MHHRDDAGHELHALHVRIEHGTGVAGRAFGPRQNMEREGHRELLRGGPERLVVRMRIRPLGGRFPPDHRPCHAPALDPLQLGHRGRDILERNKSQRDQALEIILAILRGPVIEGTETRRAELGIRESEERHPHRGVNDFRCHIVAVLVFNPFGRIVDSLGCLSKAALHEFGHLGGGDSGAEKGGERRRRDVLADKILARFPVESHGARRAFAEAPIEAFGPHGRGLNEMRICRNQAGI